MEALWNKAQLDRPPNACWRILPEKFDKAGFLNTINHTITELESQHALHNEAAVLSRLIYRMKCKFRSDKGLKNMEKVNRALLNYLSLGLEKEYKNLRASVDMDEKLIVLPSKQMLQYTLIRTQGFAKLMCRVEEVAQCSAKFFRSRIHLGHAWSIAIVAYAVVSRIWVLSKYLIKRCCMWYNGLYQFLDKFRIVGVPWNSGKLNLPIDLKTWLSLSWLDEDLPSIPKEANLENPMFKLITAEVDTVDIDLSVEDTNNTSTVKPQASISMDDIGECIDRKSFMLTCKAEDTFTAPKRKFVDEGTNDKVENSSIKEKSCQKKRKQIDNPAEEVTEMSTDLLTQVSNKSDLVEILRAKSYPGLNKSQWKIIRKNGKQLLDQIDEESSQKKQMKSLRKVVRTIQSWIG